jgi:hypothetical protein
MKIVKIISFLISAGFIVWIIILQRRTKKLWKGKMLGEQAEAFKHAPRFVSADEAEKRWKAIEAQAASQNPSDWKLAIIDADSLIDEILKRAGYAGKGIGERLKQIEPSDLDHLAELWEAHKLRNRIAHEAETLERRDAERAIENYRLVLKELRFL